MKASSQNDNDPPRVSVCVLAYNSEPYIRRCLDGILNQEVSFPIEVWVHDDASTDHTVDILHEYQKLEPQIIRLILQEENQFSQGVKIYPSFIWPRTKARYLAVCDADDAWIDVRKMRSQVEFLDSHPDYSLCYTNTQIEYKGTHLRTHPAYSNRRRSKKYYSGFPVPREDLDAHSLTTGNRIFASTVLLRNFFHEPDYPRQLFFETGISDWPLNLMALQRGKGKFIPELMASYLVHSEGMWSKQSGKVRWCRTVQTLCAMLTHGTYQEGVVEELEHKLVRTFSSIWCDAIYYDDFSSVLELFDFTCQKLPHLRDRLLKSVWRRDIRHHPWVQRILRARR